MTPAQQAARAALVAEFVRVQRERSRLWSRLDQLRSLLGPECEHESTISVGTTKHCMICQAHTNPDGSWRKR